MTPLLRLIILILSMTTLLACGQAETAPTAPPQSEPSVAGPQGPDTATGAGAPAPAAQPAVQPDTPVEISKELEVFREVGKSVAVPQEAMSASPVNSPQSAPEGGQGQQGAHHLGPTAQLWPTAAPEPRQIPRDTARPGAQPMVSTA